MAIDIARGMHYLHSCDPVVIHRDLKSHNLLVDERGRIKLCDFGLAKLLSSALDQNPNGDSSGGAAAMTSCGTPAWTAPEVLRSEAYSKSADVFSFGIVLWEIATRQEPHSGLPMFQVVFIVGTQGARPTIPDGCPAEFRDLIEACWSEQADDRPSFREVLERLETTQHADSFENSRTGLKAELSFPSSEDG